ncbi:MAG: glycoside hydrolase family 25 protein [Chthoniobacterales bacterium]
MKFSLGIGFLLAWQVVAMAGNSVVNLSHYDLMRPDFSRMKEQGILGIIHESSYPKYVQDAKYAERQNAAVGAGLLWGAYHFADATSPARQAEHFLNVVESSWRKARPGGRPNEVLLVLDFEKNGHYPGGTMRVDQAAEFVASVHRRTGKYPGLYGSEYRLQKVLSAPSVRPADRALLSRCWLWVANYHHTPGRVPPWSSWKMWQYTGDGVCDLPRATHPKSIANIKNAERNMFRGGADALRTFWQENGWRPGALPE